MDWFAVYVTLLKIVVAVSPIIIVVEDIYLKQDVINIIVVKNEILMVAGNVGTSIAEKTCSQNLMMYG